MKLLKVYEITRINDKSAHNQTLVNQVIVETSGELSDIVSLLNSQALQNKRNCDGDEYIAYIIKIEDVLPSYEFINKFVNINDDRNIIDYTNKINDIYDRTLVEVEDFRLVNLINEHNNSSSEQSITTVCCKKVDEDDEADKSSNQNLVDYYEKKAEEHRKANEDQYRR